MLILHGYNVLKLLDSVVHLFQDIENNRTTELQLELYNFC